MQRVAVQMRRCKARSAAFASSPREHERVAFEKPRRAAALLELSFDFLAKTGHYFGRVCFTGHHRGLSSAPPRPDEFAPLMGADFGHGLFGIGARILMPLHVIWLIFEKRRPL